MRINQSCLSDLAEAKTLRQYAAFLYFKGLYANSCIYNYSPYKLSKKQLVTGNKVYLSRTAIKSYVDWFVNMGWARKHGKNLVFNSIESISKSNKKLYVQVPNEIRHDIKLILNWLYLQIMKLKQQQFDFLKKLGREKNSSSYHQCRWAKQKIKKIGLDDNKLPKENDRLRVSVKKIGQYFNCSKTKAQVIISRLIENFDVSKFKDRRRKDARRGLNSGLMGALIDHYRPTFVCGNRLFFVKCNEYEF